MKPLDPRLLRHARTTRVQIGGCVALGCATAALVLAQAELLSRGVARVVEGVQRASLTGILACLALVAAGRALVAWGQDALSASASAAIKSELRRKVVARAASLGPRALNAARGAEVAALATQGLDSLDGYFGRYLPQLALAAIVPAVVVARLFAADVIAALTVLITLPLIPIFMALIGRATEASNASRWDELSRLSRHFLDVVRGLATLKVFGRAKAQVETVGRTTDRYRRATMVALRVAFLSSLVLELLSTLSVALVAVGVGLRIVRGGLDLQTGLLAILLAPEAYLPLRLVGAQYHAAAEGLAAADRAFAVIETSLPTLGTSKHVPDLRTNGWVRVAHVSVVHPGRAGAAPLDASFVARQGELLVIVGPSGAGKTTILAVLLGLVGPSAGSVSLGGDGAAVDLSTLDPSALRGQVAWLDQRPYVVAGTLADNVRLSRPDASDVAVRRALDAAGLPDMALDRRIEEAGRGLSSGERRRLAFARVVLRAAPLVLLDEPTAGLDARAERRLLATVKELARHCIVIMVSHRPAALTVADRVVHLGSTPAVEPQPVALAGAA